MMDENASARLIRRTLTVAHRVGLFLAMLVICLPGIWIVLSSLRPTVEIMAKPPVWIPQQLSFDAYIAMFSGIGKGGIPVLDYFRNSLIISVTSTVIAVAIGVFQRPGSNALRTSDALVAEMKSMAARFPSGVDYRIIYNPTEFISQSISAVRETLLEAIALVVLVVIVFLQRWRAAVIPAHYPGRGGARITADDDAFAVDDWLDLPAI